MVILPPKIESSGTPPRRIEFEHVVAGRRLGFAGAVVIERAHAGIGPDHVLRQHRLGEILAGRSAEIVDLRGRRLHLGRIAVVIAVGGADQREIVLVGNGENDAAVGVLEDVGAVVIVKFPHHDMAALHQPDLGPRVDAGT